MKFAIRTLIAFVACLFASAAAHADKPYTLATLNCTARNGGAYLSAGVYAYALQTPWNISPRYFSTYLSGSRYPNLILAEFDRYGYSTCTLSNQPRVVIYDVTIEEVSSIGVGIDVGAGGVAKDSVSQTYTEVIFSYANLNVFGAQVRPQAMSSPEQQARELEAFKARSANLLKH